MKWITILHHFFLWRVPDYIAVAVLAIVASVIGSVVHPHCRPFEWTDPAISYPLSGQDFPMYSVIVAVVCVSLLYVLGELLSRWSRPAGKLSMCLHLNGWVLVQLYSILLAFAFVNIAKLYAGRLRPDFLARLAALGVTEKTAGNYTTEQICRLAKTGRVSFPSGHAGTSFAGFVPPTIYLLGLFRVWNGGRFWLATIACILLILPVTIAISRTRDYYHNFDDILAGSICGAACGVFAVALSFRPSAVGDWTLRDHADDGAAPSSVVPICDPELLPCTTSSDDKVRSFRTLREGQINP